jgi:hypothetical protein
VALMLKTPIAEFRAITLAKGEPTEKQVQIAVAYHPGNYDDHANVGHAKVGRVE